MKNNNLSIKNFALNFQKKNVTRKGDFVKFEGYASVFEKDSQGDLILPGSFSNVQKDTPILWQHQPDTPIGVTENISEDEYGLRIRANILLNVQYGKEAYELIKNNIVRGLSIGYSVLSDRFDHESNTRLIEKLHLWEISLVTFPANFDAGVTSVHSDDSEDEGESLISSLKNANDAIKNLY